MTVFIVFLAFQALFLLSLATKTKWQKHLGFLLLIAILYSTFFRPSVEVDKGDAHLGFLLVVQSLMASDFLVLRSDTTDSLFGANSGPNDLDASSFATRLRQGLLLILDPRDIGWNRRGRVGRDESKMRESRPSFVKRNTVTLVSLFAVFRLSGYINRTGVSTALHCDIPAGAFWWRIVAVVVYGARVISFCNVLHLSVTIPLVAAGASKPEECPPLFGPFFEPYTISRFWGLQALSSHGDFVAGGLLKLNNRSNYYLVKVTTAFLLSGIIHQLGAYLTCSNPPRTAHELLEFFIWGHDMRFFVLQPLAIALERAVRNLSIGKLHGDNWKWVGYVWVLCWLTWSLSGYMDGVSRDGFMNEDNYNPTGFQMNPPEMWRALNA
ncbi:hypothetical protein VNI00_016260 [Paramarasmius palmivorus]|uniref:Wax synthase domain-containing protein n=1 Tax=Paramarasmius palmivorus TaxID=297713 RepID=A0AAW0BEK0_9AGAR